MTSTTPPSDRQDAAAADLAKRLAIDPADVELVSQDVVTWRDSTAPFLCEDPQEPATS